METIYKNLVPLFHERVIAIMDLLEPIDEIRDAFLSDGLSDAGREFFGILRSLTRLETELNRYLSAKKENGTQFRVIKTRAESLLNAQLNQQEKDLSLSALKRDLGVS